MEKLLERINTLEEDLKNLSRIYRKEVENNNILVTKMDDITKDCDKCFQNNEVLIESNLHFQVKVEALRNELAHYKQYQRKYFELLRNYRKRISSCLT